MSFTPARSRERIAAHAQWQMTGEALRVKLWRLSICHAVTAWLEETLGEREHEGGRAQREARQRQQGSWTAAKRQIRSRWPFCFYLHLLRNVSCKYHLHHWLFCSFIYSFIFWRLSLAKWPPEQRRLSHKRMTDIRAGVTPICPLWWANYFLTCLLAVLSNAASSIAGAPATHAAPVRRPPPNRARRIGLPVRKRDSAATSQPLSVLQLRRDQGGIAASRPALLLLTSTACSFPPSLEGAAGLINFSFNPKRDIKSINSGVNHWSKYLSGSSAGWFFFPPLQTLK